MDKRLYWVGFNLVKGIGAVRLQAILNHFGDLETAWKAPMAEWQASGLSDRILQNLQRVRQDVDLEQLEQKYERAGIRFYTWEDVDYPRRLKEINQAPPVFFVAGDMRPEDEWAVAIVGTRRVTAYGRQVTEEVATFLAQNGITVVSGLARGIDGISHDACLRAGGRTFAVLGSGVDRIYPPEHRSLAARIVENGALISDYPLGTEPDSVNFPPRNRIISGLSIATIVVEAGETSGALITAEFAAEQGRDVFAVPGNIYAPQSKGTNRLIVQGARPLVDKQEILELLNLDKIQHIQSARVSLPADELETQVIKILGNETYHIDEICVHSGLPIEKVSATLALMELKGMVRQVGGMTYMLIHDSEEEYRTE